MKVGDLVEYIENDMGGVVKYPGQEGLVLSGPGRALYGGNQWEVLWLNQRDSDGNSKVGWWDEFRLEVINETR